jgi:tetratricopeptide (TPR) repeat protein
MAEVQYSTALWRTWIDWDWKGAEVAFQRAIELNPNYPDPRAYYSHFLHIMKRPQEEAMAHIEKALELDPFNALFRALYGMALNYARRYDDAIELLSETLRTAPNDPVALATLISTYHNKGMYDEAMNIWKRTYASKGDSEAEEALARGYEEGGYPVALQRVAELFEERSQITYVTPWQIGTLYTRAGMKDEALKWLEKAYEAHDVNVTYLGVDPIFDDLRDDPRFKDLMRRLNLPE